MSEAMFLRCHRTHVEWLLLDDGGDVRIRGAGDYDTLAERIGELGWQGDVNLLLPAERAFLTSAAVPSRQQRQVLQAVPFVVEEQLAAEIEDCHFAVGGRLADGSVSVAVVDRHEFGRLVDDLADMNLAVVSAKIDAAGLTTLTTAAPGSAATVAVEGARSLIQTPDGKAIAVETPLLSTALALAAPSDDDDILLVLEEGDDAQLLVDQLAAELPCEVRTEVLADNTFDALCRRFDDLPIELMQGAFKVERRTEQPSSVWRSAAILAGCGFVLHLLLTVGEAIYLDGLAEQHANEAAALYAEVFPRDRNVADLKRRWDSHLSSSADESGGGFFGVFGPAVQALPASSLTLQNVNFNESRGDLILQLQAPRSEVLVQYSQQLTGAGLAAEIGTIATEDDQVRGSIKISLPDA